MFTTTRHFYKNGVEGSEMDMTFKEHDTIEKAIAYAHRYTTGRRFAGVQVEDAAGRIKYEITSGQNVHDYR